MKKRILIGLICLIVLSSYVFATGKIISLPEKNGGVYDYEYTLTLEKGWNLIAYSENFPYSAYQQAEQMGQQELPSINKELRQFYQSSGKVNDAPIIAFGYVNLNNKYLRLFPESEITQALEKNDAVWVYSKNAGQIVYFAPNVKPLSEIGLNYGWNFVAINPEMIDATFKDIKGNCNFDKSYVWNNKIYSGHNQASWEKVYDETKFTANTIGLGMVLKTSGNCKLSSSNGADTSPPPLPN